MTSDAKIQETKTDAPAQPPNMAASNIKINFSGGLANFLSQNNMSIAFTSYQSGRLYLLGRSPDGKLSLHEALYPKAMGVVADQQRIFLGTLNNIVRMENALGPDQLANEVYDKLYVPRNSLTTGNIDLHEMGLTSDGRIIFINTKFSCLCEPSMIHSFKPIWKPTFISQLVAEDRCHLNGLAMSEGKAKYVSAVCRSDVVDGWRDRRHDGGVIIDVDSDEIVAENLSMPHSPRVYDGKLWVLNSGTGEIGIINRKKKSFEPVLFAPGFLRGLAFHNGHAIATLSKPRYQRFEGLELDNRLKEKDADPWCGVQIFSLANGGVAHWIRFDDTINELFDVTVIPGVKNPLTLGPNSQEIQDFITFEALA